jgi:hypothetical protein
MNLFTILLPAAALLLAAWLCLPQILVLLKGPRIVNGFQGGPEEVTTYWLHDVDEVLSQQMLGLGFQPVGVFWEKEKMGRTFQEFVFACRTDPGFGMLYPNHQLMPRRASFLTVFTSGAVVFTKNYHGGVEAEEEDFFAGAPVKKLVPVKEPVPIKKPVPIPDAPPRDERRSVFTALFSLVLVILAGLYVLVFLPDVSFENQSPIMILLEVGLTLAYLFKIWHGSGATPVAKEDPPVPKEDPPVAKEDPTTADLAFRAPLAEVLDEHRRRVAQFLQAGHVPVPGSSHDSFLEVQRLYHEHPTVRQKYLAAVNVILGGKLFLFALVPGVLACCLGLDHTAPWACLLGEGLIMAAIRYGMSSAGVIRLLLGLPAPADERGQTKA